MEPNGDSSASAPGSWRHPTDDEQRLFARLLSREFRGRGEVAEQLESAQVRISNYDGCLEIKPHDEAPSAPGIQRVPVEAQGTDVDGAPIHALLHVPDGRAKKLEFIKWDGTSIEKLPAADAWEIRVAE